MVSLQASMFCSSKRGEKLTVEGGWPLYNYFQAHPTEVAGEQQGTDRR